MAIKPLKDNNGAIKQAYEDLPKKLHDDFFKSLAELEDNECHRTQNFPHTQLHKVKGAKKSVYRAYINKVTGWRIHLQYGYDNYIEINEILTGQEHDDVTKIIKSRKGKYK